jgi:hypothetical protein
MSWPEEKPNQRPEVGKEMDYDSGEAHVTDDHAS